MTLQETRALLAQVGDEARALIDDQYALLNDEVLPALDERRRAPASGAPSSPPPSARGRRNISSAKCGRC